MKILTWNLARHAPDSWQGEEIERRILEAKAEIVCATEAHAGSLDRLEGHVLSDAGVRWGEELATERKVLAWSAREWTKQVSVGQLSETGGAVCAQTSTTLGNVQVVAVCMPYHMAWPRERSPEVRPAPWSEHLAFLDALKGFLTQLDDDLPTILVGDFNQYDPLNWGSWDAHHALNDALGRLNIVTKGTIEPVGEQTVDHVAVSPHLRADAISSLDRYTDDGRALSDHFGVLVTLQAGGTRLVD